MADMSKISPDNGLTIYDLKDAAGRQLTQAVKYGLSIRKNKRIIVMGDSYNVSYDGTTEQTVTSVGARMAALYPDRASEIIKNWAVGGAGFSVKSGDYTYNEFLDANYQSVSDPNTVTDLLLFGGYNEIMESYAQGYAGGITFCGKVAQYFPNCKVHLAFVAWGYRSDTDMSKLNDYCISIYQDVARDAQNACYVENAPNILHDYSLCGTDGVHPTAAGYQVLAKALGAYIFNGSPIEIYSRNIESQITFVQALGGSLSLFCYRDKDITKVITRSYKSFSNISVKFDSSGEYLIGTIPATGLLYGYANSNFICSIRIPVICGLVYNGSGDYIPCEIRIRDGNVYLWAFGYGNITVTAMSISQISTLLMTQDC